jgi:dTDP-4-dehydrorhamnose reductase
VKILLFGGAGQLGSAIRTRAHDLAFEVAAPVAKEVDIREAQQVEFLVRGFAPDVVINCAAFTAIDRAEEEQELCFAINRDGAANVARACVKGGARLIHLSTDYVFDGTGNCPLTENDPTNPINIYGRSKLAGEEAVRDLLGEKALVIRTQSLFGSRGNNFLHTLLTLLPVRDTLKIVSDHYTSPTPVGWLSGVILDLIRLKCGGTIHAAVKGGVSLRQVAEFVVERYKQLYPDRRIAQIEPTTTSEVARPAARPLFLTLDTSKLVSLLGRATPSWEVGVEEFLRAGEQAERM